MGSYLSSFFIEAHNALLQFLGLVIVDQQSKTQEGSSTSSSEKQEDEKASEESSQDPPPTTTDPKADPPTDNSVISLSLSACESNLWNVTWSHIDVILSFFLICFGLNKWSSSWIIKSALIT